MRLLRGNGRKLVALALVMGLVCTQTYAAPDLSDAKQEKRDLQDQLEDVQGEIARLRDESESTESYMEDLDKKLSEITASLASLESQVAQKEAQVEENREALAQAQADSQKQYEDMKKRIKFLYENGNDAYFEMLLEAKSFAELVNKADFVKEMSEYDRNMLEQFLTVQQTIAEKQEQIEEECRNIQALKAQTEKQKESMQVMADEKQKEYDAYQDQLKESEDLAAQVEAEIAAQEALIASLEAEAARRRKAEEEARAKAQAAASAAGGGSASEGTGGGSGSPQSSSDGFIWPCPASRRITSDYGYRIHPTLNVRKLHNGIDIGAPTGTQIVAAASGLVVAASYDSSMGNYVMIDHGNSVYTVYMHCSGFNVFKGQQVSQGSVIAFVGSTGRSTGPHLHFSVRVNGGYVNPWNYL